MNIVCGAKSFYLYLFSMLSNFTNGNASQVAWKGLARRFISSKTITENIIDSRVVRHPIANLLLILISYHPPVEPNLQPACNLSFVI
jgi:hypothetical protein